MEAMVFVICAWEPEPIATITMTEPTPMMIPSEVRMLRILLRKMLRMEKETSLPTRMRPPSRRKRVSRA